MIFNWYLQRREFQALARMSKESEERTARILRELHKDHVEMGKLMMGMINMKRKPAGIRGT